MINNDDEEFKKKEKNLDDCLSEVEAVFEKYNVSFCAVLLHKGVTMLGGNYCRVCSTKIMIEHIAENNIQCDSVTEDSETKH